MILRLHQKKLCNSEKLPYGINRKTAKVSVLSSDNIQKYEYLTGEDI